MAANDKEEQKYGSHGSRNSCNFIRSGRSQIQRALQPATTEVEEASLKNGDIYPLLHGVPAAAQQSGHGRWPRVKKANMEAAPVFKPVLEAAHQLAQALGGNAHITLTMRDNDVELAIGQERRVRVSRYGWQRDFAVEDHIYCPDLGDSVERTNWFLRLRMTWSPRSSEPGRGLDQNHKQRSTSLAHAATTGSQHEKALQRGLPPNTPRRLMIRASSGCEEGTAKRRLPTSDGTIRWGDGVAGYSVCGHSRHMRHHPPRAAAPSVPSRLEGMSEPPRWRG